ncbi:MAG: MOSC domain-containing protein [Caldilineaceae bacterium]|nr:MOSC domain-containing protein [Caldilineaceae bacterium]
MTTQAQISDIQRLLDTLPQVGEVLWIGLRPGHRAPIQSVELAEARIGSGLVGDRFRGRPDSKRQVTLIQAEHLAAVGSMLGREPIDPSLTRRNIIVAGINLLALKDKQFRIGDAILEMTGLCHPCSRMEENLGLGGYNAMRGHGGITAKVIEEGTIRVGDRVYAMSNE